MDLCDYYLYKGACMIQILSSHILSFIIFLPLIMGFIILAFFGKKSGKLISLITTIIVLILGFIVFFKFDPNGGMQFSEVFILVKKYGINYAVGVDGMNLLILVVIACAFPPLFFILKEEGRGYWANILFIQSAFLAVILSKDLVFFYAGWEMMLLPIFILIGLYGKSKARTEASFNMMYYAIVGSMIMLCAIIYVGVVHYHEFGFFSFLLEDLQKITLDHKTENILFFCFMLAFAIKLPLFPFHLWLPEAYTKSPTVATFLLSTIASKVALFAILRFVLSIFPYSFVHFSGLFICIGLFSMLYCGIAAIKVRDFKTILAYASASHLGLILAGVFALDVEAMVGSMYQVVAHAMAGGIMFLLVGKISEQLLTRDIANLGGIAIKAPVFAFIFAVAMISSVGLPATIGFVAELLIIFGLFKLNLVYGILATTSIVIGAVYMFLIYRRAILQNSNELTDKFTDLNKKQIFAFLIPVIIIFVLGIFPTLFTSKIEPTMKSHYEQFIKPNLGIQK